MEVVRPDVVHVTTPPSSHHALARVALDAGAHVIVEKPATTTFEELTDLMGRAERHGLTLIENYNYLFNIEILKILDWLASANFGTVVHVEVCICLDILGEEGPFADPNERSPTRALVGDAIADFLPHLASLAHAFVGPHRAVRTLWSKRSNSPLLADEFRALVEAERGTALLGFSAHAQPDAFWVHVHGERMRVATNLFEARLTCDRLRDGAKPLRPFWNALDEARAVRRSAFGSLSRKLSGGPGAYEGLWELLRRAYGALATGREPPISMGQVRAVNRLVAALQSEGSRFDVAGGPIKAGVGP